MGGIIYIYWLVYLLLLQLFRLPLVYPLLVVLSLGLAYLLVGIIVGAIRSEKSGRDKLVSEPWFVGLTCTELTPSRVLQIGAETSVTYLREATGCR